MASDRNTDLFKTRQLNYIQNSTHHWYVPHHIINMAFKADFVKFTMIRSLLVHSQTGQSFKIRNTFIWDESALD